MTQALPVKRVGLVDEHHKRAMSGPEFVQGLVDGTLPLNPLAETLGYDIVDASKGRRSEPQEALPMDSNKLNGRTPVPWSNDPAVNASAIIDALARSGANLICVNDAVYLPDADGHLLPLGRDALLQACRDHLVSMRVLNVGTTQDPRYKIVYEPINELDGQTLRNVLAGMDLRYREPLKSGTLASRVPRLTV